MSAASTFSSRGVLSNGIVALGAQGINYLSTYFSTIIIINTLGEYRYGIFSYTMVIIGITSILTDFGMNPIILRTLSQSLERGKQIIGNATIGRLLLFIPTAVVTNIIAALQRHDADFMLILNVMLLNILFSAKLPILRGTFETFFRARARMGIPALIGMFDSLILLALTIFAREYFTTPLRAMMTYTASNIVGCVIVVSWCISLLRKDTSQTWRADKTTLRNLIRESAPLALFLFMIALHLYVDSFYLDWFLGKQAVGEYNAALRLINPFIVFPTITAWAIVPFVARLSAQNSHASREQMLRVYSISMKTLIVFSCCLAIIGARISPAIVQIAFAGNYTASVQPLIFFFLSYPFITLNLFQVEINTALGYQQRNTIFSIIVALLACILGFIMIPMYGLVGAAATKLITIVCGFTYLFYTVQRVVHWQFFSTALKILTIILLACGCSLLVPREQWLVQMIIITACFVMGMFLLRLFSTDELKIWWTQITSMFYESRERA